MAITAADLQVKLSTSGADAVKRDLQGVGQAVDDTSQKSSRMGSTIATAFRWGLIGAATGAIAGGTAAIGSFIMGASNLAEAQSKVNVVFGESAGQVNTWAKAAADAFGITEADALAVTGTMGNLFTNMGFTKDAAAGMSTEIVGLSADMSSFFNVSQPQVIDALTSAFVGEYDALQRLGVPISAAAVEQYALNNGIWDGVDAMTDAERATAVYQFTMEKTANAQGDFARTSGDLANKVRILKANFANLGASIGKVLVPAAIKLTGWGIDAIDWLSEMGNPLDAIADKFGFIGDIFDPLIDTFDRFSDSFRNLTEDVKEFGLWGAEIGTVVEGMNAVPAFFIALGNTIAGLGDGIPIVEDIGKALMEIGETIIHLTDAYDHFRTMGLDPVQAGLRALGVMFPLIGDLAGDLQLYVGQLTEAFRSLMAGDFGGAFDSIAAAAQSALNVLGDLGGIAIDVVVSIGSFLWETAVDVGTDLVQWIKDNGLDIAQDIGSVALSIGSIIWSATADIFSGLALWLQGNISGIAQDIGTVAVSVGSIAWNATSDIFGGFVTWASGMLNLQDFTPVGNTVGAKIMAAISIAFSAGNAAGGATGGVFNIGASILNWINGQIEGQLGGGFEGIGQRIGQALAAAVAGVFAVGAGGGILGIVGSSFSNGLLSAISEKVSSSGFSDAFWRLFSNIGQAGGEVFEGVAEGFIQSFTKAIAPEGTLTLPGGFKINIPNIEFGGSLATAFKHAFLESAMPGSQMDLNGVKVAFEDIDLGDISGAFRDAFIEAALPGGTLLLDVVNIDVGDLNWLFPEGNGEDPVNPGLEPVPVPEAEGWMQWASDATAAIGMVKDAANGARDAIGGVFSGSGGRDAAGGGAGAGAIVSSIASVVASLTTLQAAAQTASAAMAGMTAAVTTGMAMVRGAVTLGMAAVIAAVANGMATARAVTASGAAGMAASMVAGMAAFRGAVTSGMASAVGAVRAGISAMVAAASAGRGMMMSAGLGIGAALGQGIAAGIQSQIGAVAAAAAALVSTAVGAARSAGAISSPSRVMQDQVGRMLGLGVETGILQSLAGIQSAASQMIPSLAGSGGSLAYAGAGSGGAGTTLIVNNYITVEGDLTAEAQLTDRIGQVVTRSVAIGLRDDLIRHRTAAGVAI